MQQSKCADQLRAKLRVRAKLIFVFVFAYAERWFSHDEAPIPDSSIIKWRGTLFLIQF